MVVSPVGVEPTLNGSLIRCLCQLGYRDVVLLKGFEPSSSRSGDERSIH